MTRDRAEWMAGGVAVLGSHWLKKGFFSRDFHLFDLTFINIKFLSILKKNQEREEIKLSEMISKVLPQCFR